MALRLKSLQISTSSRETEHMELTMKEYDAILITNTNKTVISYKIRCISVLLLKPFNFLLKNYYVTSILEQMQ